MKNNKGNLSEARSYKEIGDFWDTHDLSDFWNKTKKITFDVDVRSEITYCALDRELSEQLQAVAQKRGVSADTLLNLWLQEKLQEQNI